MPIPSVFSFTFLPFGLLQKIILSDGTQVFEEYVPHTCQDFVSLYQSRVSCRCLSETPSFPLLYYISMDNLYCVRFRKEAGAAQLHSYCRRVFKFHHILLSLEIPCPNSPHFILISGLLAVVLSMLLLGL